MAKNTGIRTRHGRACASRSGRVCNCNPSYEAWVYSARDRRKIRRHVPDVRGREGLAPRRSKRRPQRHDVRADEAHARAGGRGVA